MTVSTSYRLDPGLKARVAEAAAQEGITETAFVSRLLHEGLEARSYPGVVYREGPTGRRAAIAGGPDVWEVIVAVRHARGRGDAKIADAAEQLGIAERLVRVAVDFAAAHAEEIEDRIARNDDAAERARRLAQERERLLAS